MEEVYDEKVNIKLNFYGELIDYTINSDYLSFLKDICGIFGLSMNQLGSISLSYTDEDGDIIILSTKEDFSVFLEQAKQKVVDILIVEVNEESNIDPISLMDSALNYQEQVEEANASLINSNQNNINNDNNNNYYNNNNYDDYNDNIQSQEVNNEAPLIFYVECNKCQISPLMERIYYCQQCDICICQDCLAKNGNHEHPLNKIETENDFDIIIKAYEKRAKLAEKNSNNLQSNNINYQNNQNSQNNSINNINQKIDKYHYNDYYPPNPKDYFIPPHKNYCNQNDTNQRLFPFGGSGIIPLKEIPFLLKPLEKISKKAKKHFKKKKILFGNNPVFHGIVMKKVKEARERYDLEGINDQDLINALYKARGNIDQAIDILTQ